MTIIDTTTVSVLFALVALAIVTGVVATGVVLAKAHGFSIRVPRTAKPVMHGRFAL